MRAQEDPWAAWLLAGRRRDGGRATGGLAERLSCVRDRVLDGATLRDGDTLLDVGSGDGLVGLAALDRIGATGAVIFSDISHALLEHCRTAVPPGARGRARFLRASATDLSAVPDASVDAVTTRAVLIYVEDKRLAFEEFRRVLRPGGRLSIWEPINSFAFPEPEHQLFGYDVRPVLELAARVRAVYDDRGASLAGPMLGFNERDLLAMAEGAGFEDLTLELRAEVRSQEPVTDWEALLETAPNPLAPTWSEAIAEALEPAQAKQFLSHLRPLVEAGDGTWRMAESHLRARVPGSHPLAAHGAISAKPGRRRR